jgi:pyruvate-formate lyase-activating enzyme
VSFAAENVAKILRFQKKINMKEYPKLLVADKNGEIFDIPGLEAAGMEAGRYYRLSEAELIKIHPDSEFFVLPDRFPVGRDPDSGKMTALKKAVLNGKNKKCFPVSVFLAPGYTALLNAAFRETKKAEILPLFSYAAVAMYKGQIYAAAVRVDKEKRQELAGMDMAKVSRRVKDFRKIFPDNRLVRHLEKCALLYGCPAAKNFFLSRYEGPLPTSPVCNSRCIGCISYQPSGLCPVAQPRINFVPSAREIAEAALFHIKNVKDPVVSFGQGCEGEPLMSADVIEAAVQMIRQKTGKGIINANTNASRPESIKRLFKAGLDSIRVSMNSVRKEYYNAYYRPSDYSFEDVMRSIREAKRQGGFVSINYLVMPGLTDSIYEIEELIRFIRKTKINMIQWRNLNFDPIRYFEKLKIRPLSNELVGMGVALKEIRNRFPDLMSGYFNSSRSRIKRAGIKYPETDFSSRGRRT